MNRFPYHVYLDIIVVMTVVVSIAMILLLAPLSNIYIIFYLNLVRGIIDLRGGVGDMAIVEYT